MLRHIFLSMIVIGGLVPAAASAQLVVGNTQLASYSDLMQRMDSMETELASFRSQEFAAFDTSCGGPSCGSTCDDTPCCGTCCIRSGWYAGFDMVIAKPYFEDAIEPGDSEYDFEFSPRFILGAKNDCGTGIRARYWWYDADSSVADGTGSLFAGDQLNMKMSVFDLELTQDVYWGPVQATIFGGVRYADMSHTAIAGLTDFQSQNGWGPTIGIDTLTSLPCQASLIENIRYAALFGIADSTFEGPKHDNGFGSIETQLGVQWERGLGCGVLRLRGIVESQLWMASLEDPEAIFSGVENPDENLFMLGFVFGIEYLR
ncbi:MAG: Lpg1974 family pore-forming outer membrane protein [Pirellulales bacterium]|jgi:hypothetical protein